jgi:hypothetical protein
VIVLSIDFRVNRLYSISELQDSLSLDKFMPHYSMWSDGSDVYLFHHLPFKRLKIKYELEKVIYKRINADLDNCFSPARMGL